MSARAPADQINFAGMGNFLIRLTSVRPSDADALRWSHWGTKSAENSALQYGHFTAFSSIVLAQFGQSRARPVDSSVMFLFLWRLPVSGNMPRRRIRRFRNSIVNAGDQIIALI